VDAPDPVTPLEQSRADQLRAELGEGKTLRGHAAQGTIVNAAFTVGLQGLGMIRAFVVATIIAPDDYGLWGIIVVSYATLMRIKHVGMSDKFIQQAESEQEVAFQKAFTLEFLLNAFLFVLLIGLAPVVTLVYDEPRLLVPSLVTALVVPAALLQSPLWVYYRRMNFVRQRTLQSIDPVVALIVTVGLAIAGAGYWSFVIGTLAGGWAAALVIVGTFSYRLRFRYDRGTMREYASFSGPLFVAAVTTAIIAQGTVWVADQAIGLAAVGALSLAASITTYSQTADRIVTQTLYPAICAVRDRTDLLFESFVKSNRLALMWGVPFGVAVALFAPDFVEYVMDESWEPAVIVLQAAGLVSAIGHIGFNWDAYFRAIGNTRPIAKASMISLVAFGVGPIPLMIAYDLKGYAAGLGVAWVASFCTRWYFLSKLFSGFAMARHAARAIAPTIPAVALILALRIVERTDRTFEVALIEGAIYAIATALATWFFERDLLREVVVYLRRRQTPAGAAA
jgi:O-antigen/teichoic acid export membrane protein